MAIIATTRQYLMPYQLSPLKASLRQPESVRLRCSSVAEEITQLDTPIIKTVLIWFFNGTFLTRLRESDEGLFDTLTRGNAEVD
jgi:hypothetical protein